MPATIVQGEWYSEALGRPTQISGLLPANLSMDDCSLAVN